MNFDNYAQKFLSDWEIWINLRGISMAVEISFQLFFYAFILFNYFFSIHQFMKTYKFIIVAAGLLFGACSSDNDDMGSNERKNIELSRAESEIVGVQNGTAFKMLSYFNENSESDNFMVSPLSAQFALGMLANGAEGNTLAELENALGVGALDELNTLNSKLLAELPKADKETTVEMANSMWLNTGFNVYPEYSKCLADFYRAESRTLELASTEAMKEINRWTSKKTKGLVPELLLRPLKKDTRIALINAIYFKGEWDEPFKKELTAPRKFLNIDGTTSQPATMRLDGADAKYYSADKYELASLDYGNGAYSMTILLPAEDSSLDEAISMIDSQAWSEYKQSGRIRGCNVLLPKFNIETRFDLIPYLMSLGVHDTFDRDAADFSSLSEHPVFVSMVKQVTNIMVDEKGTEAAAVTIVGGDTEAVLGPDFKVIDFFVDRPFAFIIEERSTGAILFMGRVNRL